MFYFHSQVGSTVEYCGTVDFDMCIRRTRLFLSRVSILTRDIDIANLYSVRLSVCNVPVSNENGLTYGQFFHRTVAQSF